MQLRHDKLSNVIKRHTFFEKSTTNLKCREISPTFCGQFQLRSLKNKDKTCSPPLRHIAQAYIAHKIAPAVWTFEAQSKKNYSVSFLSTSISSIFLQNCSVIYVASSFPPSFMCKLQPIIDTTLEAQTYMRECSKEASALLWLHLLTTRGKGSVSYQEYRMRQ